MDRRTFISLVGGAGLGGFLSKFSFGQTTKELNFGWIPNPAAVQEFVENTDKPYFSQWSRHIRGDGRDKQVLLLKGYEKVTGVPFEPHYQQIGSCVGEGHTLAAEIVSAMQILSGKNEKWLGKHSVEVAYAGSRTAPECGAGQIRRGDGSAGVWCATFQQRYGQVLRAKYGQYDVSKPNYSLARDWGRSGVGVPSELLKLAKEHPVRTVSLVTSFDQLADCITNGFPVACCSGRGFHNRADRQGFLSPSGYWSHCMAIVGIDTKSKRKGAMIANSWGSDWVTGCENHVLGCAPGCFWADADVVDGMLKAGDSWALSNFLGYPRRRLDYVLV